MSCQYIYSYINCVPPMKNNLSHCCTTTSILVVIHEFNKESVEVLMITSKNKAILTHAIIRINGNILIYLLFSCMCRSWFCMARPFLVRYISRAHRHPV